MPQAGNKSLLSYNTTVGVPGYSGYIPSHAGLSLPVKGFEHTGRPPTTKSVIDLTLKTVDGKRATQYQEDYLKKPGDTQPTDKTGGGYWISQRTVPPSNVFLGTTTYRTEVGDAVANTARQLDRSKDLACTVVGYEAARQAGEVRRSLSVDPRQRAMETVGP